MSDEMMAAFMQAKEDLETSVKKSEMWLDVGEILMIQYHDTEMDFTSLGEKNAKLIAAIVSHFLVAGSLILERRDRDKAMLEAANGAQNAVVAKLGIEELEEMLRQKFKEES